MIKVEQKFTELSNEPSDINEHLVVLRYYADKCSHVTELGVRRGVSTWAFLSSMAKRVVSVDVNHPNDFGGSLQELRDASVEAKVDFTFILADDLSIELEETELLFIDALHTYGHLKKELALHADKSRKYIIFHDTVQYGTVGLDGGEGIEKAIREFLDEHEEWKVKEAYTNNNGLLILERCMQ
jgi:predicted O-methyltransferase YrrM